MNFDREKFFAGYRQRIDTLNQGQVDALNELLDFIEADSLITDLRHVAYMLATSKHETAHTFRPIHEHGSRSYFISRYGSQTSTGKRLGNDTPEEGATYAGRGQVQLTGEYNYEVAEQDMRKFYPDVVARFEARTGKKFDLTVGDQPNDERDPDNAMDAEIAYCIMSNGMRMGRFTGKKLTDYIAGATCDYVHARAIINGLDRASLIAGYAMKFEKILRASTVPDAVAASGLESSSTVAPAELATDTPVALAQTSVSIEDGNVQVKTTESSAPPEKVAIEKPEPQAFAKMRNKLAALTGGNMTLQGIRDYAEQAKLFGLSLRFWFWVSIIAVVGTAVYIAIEFFKYRADAKRDLELTNQLIQANTTPANVVQLVDKDKVEDYRARGYKIVTR
jgi:hypothetical protein